MNIEKFVNSKFYRGFEWFYRLIFLNLFTFVVSFSLAAIPFLVWYNNQELVYFIYLAIILFVVLFIPAFITSLIVIKYYIDDNTGNFFVLYQTKKGIAARENETTKVNKFKNINL